MKFIPRPVVIGFTNGIALLIASTQIKDFFGIGVDKVPGEFVSRLRVLAMNASHFSAPATLLSLFTLAVILLTKCFSRRIPGSIAGLLLGAAAGRLLGLNVETIGSRFGGIPTGLPHFSIPVFRLDLLGH